MYGLGCAHLPAHRGQQSCSDGKTPPYAVARPRRYSASHACSQQAGLRAGLGVWSSACFCVQQHLRCVASLAVCCVTCSVLQAELPTRSSRCLNPTVPANMDYTARMDCTTRKGYDAHGPHDAYGLHNAHGPHVANALHNGHGPHDAHARHAAACRLQLMQADQSCVCHAFIVRPFASVLTSAAATAAVWARWAKTPG